MCVVNRKRNQKKRLEGKILKQRVMRVNDRQIEDKGETCGDRGVTGQQTHRDIQRQRERVKES